MSNFTGCQNYGNFWLMMKNGTWLERLPARTTLCKYSGQYSHGQNYSFSQFVNCMIKIIAYKYFGNIIMEKIMFSKVHAY